MVVLIFRMRVAEEDAEPPPEPETCFLRGVGPPLPSDIAVEWALESIGIVERLVGQGFRNLITLLNK